MLELALEATGERRLLVARFARDQRLLSWAIVGGGASHGREVAWCQVKNDELTQEVDAGALLAERLVAAGIPGAVGLLTSSNVGRYVQHTASSEGLEARCVVTVGLGNRLRAGDSPGTPQRPSVGTINLLCAISQPLTERAMIEATALCAEARAVAVLESGVTSLRSGQPASGTGTDCHVMAAPEDGLPLEYVGKHTNAGHLIGHVVLAAVKTGVRAWLAKHGQQSILP
jgi:adenosylcobinamide amidohydrolase